MKRSLRAIVLIVASCSPGPLSSSSKGAREPRSSRGYGAVMSDIGHRFELGGRAAAANRFELAAFEVDEMRELFESDLPHAELPKEGASAALPAMAHSFALTHLPELMKAAQAKDGRAFAGAFQRASTTCNGCHEASGHGFIQIPSTPGKAVPNLDPITAP